MIAVLHAMPVFRPPSGRFFIYHLKPIKIHRTKISNKLNRIEFCAASA